MKKVITDLLAGAVATVPMSWAMDAMHRMLPDEQQYPLPPRLITERLTAAAGVRHQLSVKERVSLALAAHFGYGASVGALYQVVAPRMPGRPVTRGMLYGMIVWAGSYLGLLPALGILKPATQHPMRRNLVMIIAHLVWGSALAIFEDAFERAGQGRSPAFIEGASKRRATHKLPASALRK